MHPLNLIMSSIHTFLLNAQYKLMSPGAGAVS